MRPLTRGWLAAAFLTSCAACGGSAQTTPGPDSLPSAPPPAVKPPEAGLAVQPVPGNATAVVPDPGLVVVRELTGQFYRGDLIHLRERFSPEFKEMMSLEKLAAIRTKVESEYGKEVAMLHEDRQVKGKYRGYARFARFDKYQGLIEVQWILHLNDDEVAGFYIRPAKRNG